MAYLSLCASGTTDTTSEPYYVGSSSGATIARIIQSSIFRSSGKRAVTQPGVQTCQATGTSRPPAPPESTQSDEPVADFPDRQQARMLFDVFFERIHTRWPLLDRVIYTKLFEKQFIRGALTIIERSMFHLIYAITARFLSLTRKPCGVDSEVRFTRADHTMILTDRSITLSQLPSQWTIFWINITSRRYNFSSCLEYMARDRLTVQAPGLRSDLRPPSASRWAYTGRKR